MTTTITERDPSLTAAYLGVAASGVLLVAGAVVFGGFRTALSAGVGVALALSNLWLIERAVGLYLRAQNGRWRSIAVVKAALVLGLVAVLLKGGAADVLPLLFGFSALPLGVVVGRAWPAGPMHEGG